MGCDRKALVHTCKPRVSIHAPTWGATNRMPTQPKQEGVSIHAPTWGATVVYSIHNVFFLFQSTHPRGVRQKIRFMTTYDLSFNPRTHVGCDMFNNLAVRCRLSFNPRTHVGCDLTASRCHRIAGCFNPRTHVGCDTSAFPADKCNTVSIHAPTWGATSR